MKNTRGKRARFGTVFAAALGLFTAALAPAAQATTRNVPGTYPTIQSAITAASNGDIVLIAPGTYTGTGNQDINFGGKAITVTSSGGAASTIIDCQGTSAAPHQAFLFNTNETSASVLQGLTIQHAYRPATLLGLSGGGAIQIDNASPTINQCVFKNNTADTGGAIYASNGNASITQCDFIANIATISTLNVNDYGGAIYVNAGLLGSGRISIADCTFQSNVASSDGGAIGTGGLLSGMSVSIYNCSFYNNNAEGQGEAVSLSSEPGTIAFSGILNGSTTITNCILYGDASPAELSTALPILTDNNVTYSDINQTGFAGSNNNISADPKYVDPANGNLHLGNGSPAIGAGTAVGAPTVDHDGFAWSGAVSMGAFDAAPATHFQVTTSSPVTAGVPFTVTVTALDARNNTAYAYAGPVHFTSTDPQAILPADSAVTNGTGTFSATLKTSGSQTITVSDSANASINGTSTAITVTAAAATRVILTVPTNATAGAPFNVTVTAVDAFGNTAPSYTGTIHFTSTDPQAVLPANGKLTNGVGTFQATLKTAGNQTITATDTVTAGITGTSGAITVGAAAASHIVVSSPPSATAGSPVTLTVKALDAFGNTVTGYTGAIHFTSTDPQAVLPANATLTNGVGTFQATLKTAGNQTVTATDTVNSSITGTSSPVSISAGAVTGFSVSTSASATAGTPVTLTVKALDAFGNTNTGYSGTVHFTSTDPQAVLPANTALTNGAGTFQVTLKTAGNQTVTATDTATPSLSGTSSPVTVSAAAATARIVITAPASATAGTPVTLTVKSVDAFGNTTTTYTGTLHFTSTDSRAALPANGKLTNGLGTFQATLKTAGSQTVTATDTANSSITGTSGAIAIGAGTTTMLLVRGRGPFTAGTPFQVSVAATDSSGNTNSAFTGTVHFTSSDPQAVLPADTALVNGAANVNVTLKTSGAQTITATVTTNSGISGVGSFAVTAGSATHIVVNIPANAPAGSPITVTVMAADAFGNPAPTYAGTLHFTSSDPNAILPANATLTNGVGTFQATLKTTGHQTLTVTDTANPALSGAASVTIGAGAAAQVIVTVPASATAGSPVTVTVKAVDQFGNTVTGYSGTLHFTSTDPQAALPANGTLTNGVGTFQATLKTAGSQTITATDTITPSVGGTSSPITIGASSTAHIVLTMPTSSPVGSPITITAQAVDQYGNPTSGYSGTIHFTSTDPRAILPADITLTNGSGSGSATLKTSGSQSITATDTANPGIFGTSTITIGAGSAIKLVVSAPASQIAGNTLTFVVKAVDQYGNVDPTYAGTIHFTSSDHLASLPADTVLTGGSGSFTVTLRTSGAQTVTATDTSNAAFTATSTVTIIPGPPVMLQVRLRAPFVSGGQFSLNVFAMDQFQNLAPTYTGTVHFTGSDPNAILPADSTLPGGSNSFRATYLALGNQTITATDTARPSMTNTAAFVNTQPVASKFAITIPATDTAGTPISVQVVARDSAGNTALNYTGTLHFTSTDPQAVLPMDTTLTNGVGTFSATPKTAGRLVITITDAGNFTVTGSSGTETVSPGAATQIQATAQATAVSGVPFGVMVSALDAYGNIDPTYTGAVHITSTDPQAVLPADTTLNSGQKIVQVTLKTVGGQTVTATDTVRRPALTGKTAAITITAH